MNVDRVRVRGLFDHFDHDLEFRTDERVMIVIGPNGFGKTTTLRLIDTLFNQSLHRLTEMSFRSMEVSFDQGKRLVVEKEDHTKQDDDGPQLNFIFQDGSGNAHKFHYRPRQTGQLKMDFGEAPTVSQHDLQDLLNAVTVRLIDTERLTRTNRRKRTVRVYSEELAGLVSKTIAKYAALSHSLDRTFPARVVTGNGTSETSMKKELTTDLDEIERNQSRLEKAGLLSTEQYGIDVPDLNKVDRSRLDVLSVHAQDTKQKLEVFDDLYPKIDAFMTIANSRLRYKRVSVSAEGLKVVSWTGADLDLDLLSSGEQHELVILYELLFRTSKNSLILIDEPELSLHVAWQEQFVSDLEKMAKISHFRALLATHSPEIIADRWDLTVKLSGPNVE